MVTDIEYKYLEEGRLGDIITLISVLALENWSYRNEVALTDSLNSTPSSAITWLDLAKQHPEFFRINKDDNSAILLVRYLDRDIVDGKDDYKKLTVDQAQKLIEQAISLHDKQLARKQRNSYLVPIFVALITASTAIGTLYFTPRFNGVNEIKSKIDSIRVEIKRIKN